MERLKQQAFDDINKLIECTILEVRQRVKIEKLDANSWDCDLLGQMYGGNTYSDTVAEILNFCKIKPYLAMEDASSNVHEVEEDFYEHRPDEFPTGEGDREWMSSFESFMLYPNANNQHIVAALRDECELDIDLMTRNDE